MIEMGGILCPIDFSAFSRRALNHATAIAHWYGATVTLLNVQSSAGHGDGRAQMLPQWR